MKSIYVVISLNDPDKRTANIPKQSGLRDVMYLAFYNAEPVGSVPLPDNIKLMTPEQALELRTFVRRWAGEVGAIVLHLE